MAQNDPLPAPSSKSRGLVLTDIENEPDDAQSLVRFLLYTNEMDMEGLLATTSVWMQDTTRADKIRGHIEIVDNPWLLENIRTGHGPLGARYPATVYLMEGDTPSFMNLFRNGLADYEDLWKYSVDAEALREAQTRQDALAAQRLVLDLFLG